MAQQVSISECVARAYGGLFGNLGTLAHIALPAALVGALVGWGGEILFAEDYRGAATDQVPSAGLVLAMLVSVTVAAILVAIIAVGWHRFILLGETVSAPRDLRYLRYVWYEIVVGIIGILFGFLVTIPIALIAALTRTVSELFLLATIPAFLLMILIWARYLLVFPATAIEDRSITLARSRVLMRGSTWRAFLGMLAITVPFMLINFALSRLLFDPADPEASMASGGLALQVVTWVLTTLATALAAGYMSEVYRAVMLAAGSSAAGGEPRA